MKKELSTYHFRHRIISIFLLLALCWLTVSTPFVYAAQQMVSAVETYQDDPVDEEQATTPVGSTTEEKSSSSVSTVSEEFINHDDDLINNEELFRRQCGSHTVAKYASYHGELLCPPPNSGGIALA